MRMTEFDVIVAGGGPGGLSAAEAAAKAGARVLVLERNREIGSPARTTGGTFIRDMKALGIPDSLYHPVRRCRFVSPNQSAAFDYAEPMACVLDIHGTFQFLAQRAIAAGAMVRVGSAAEAPVVTDGVVTGVRAKTVTGAQIEYSSKVLIDATGYRSQLLRQCGVSEGARRFGVGAEYDLYAPMCDQDEVVLIVGSQIAPSGYAWVAPWGRGRVRVGVGIIHDDSPDHPEGYLDVLMERAAEFGVNLTGAQPVEYHYGLIPSDGVMEAFAGDGVLGVGDAAGHPSALVGEGIRWAIWAGTMAGEAAGEAVRTGDCSKKGLKRFEERWNREHGRNLKIAAEINKRIARWDDARWDRGTELLKMLTPDEFAEALQSNFTAGWLMKVALKNPSLMKEGLARIGKMVAG